MVYFAFLLSVVSKLHRLILNAHPAAAGEKNMLGFWPLQLCIKSKVTDTPLLLEVLRKHPVAASLVDEHGRRTIHYAASRNMDMSFVKALLEADKKGASAQDKNGQIPLHLAVIRGAIELATILLKFHPNGVMDVDRYGMVALNYAIENDASMDMITLLVQSNPLCVRNIITGNRTVLHHAVEFRRSTEIIQLLVNSFPESARVQESVLGGIFICHSSHIYIVNVYLKYIYKITINCIYLLYILF